MRFILLILACFFSSYVVAGIYKCTGEKGETQYRSSPCQTGQSNVEINIKTGSATNLDEKIKQQALAQKDQQAALEKQALEKELLLRKQADAERAARDESEKNQLLIKNNPDKFSAYAIPPYVPEKLPALVQTFQARLADIERFRRLAAEKALASGQCGRVESVELHTKSTKDALLFFVNCSSGQAFYFQEQELTE